MPVQGGSLELDRVRLLGNGRTLSTAEGTWFSPAVLRCNHAIGAFVTGNGFNYERQLYADPGLTVTVAQPFPQSCTVRVGPHLLSSSHSPALILQPSG